MKPFTVYYGMFLCGLMSFLMGFNTARAYDKPALLTLTLTAICAAVLWLDLSSLASKYRLYKLQSLELT